LAYFRFIAELGVESLDRDLGMRDDIDHHGCGKFVAVVLPNCESRGCRIFQNPIVQPLDERVSELVPPVFFQHGQATEFVVRLWL